MTAKFEKLLDRATTAYLKYDKQCSAALIEAQKYVDWATLRWEYLPSDSLCFGINEEYVDYDAIPSINIDDMSLAPANLFFELVEQKGKVSPHDFSNICI